MNLEILFIRLRVGCVRGAFTELEGLKLISCYNVTDVWLISIAEKYKLLKSLD